MAVTRARLFGLTVESEIPLPGLLEATGDGPADVTIRLGQVSGPGEVSVPEIGLSFAIRDGREILVDAAPGTPQRNVRLYLLGSAMGMLLHQRGLLPLHANAFDVDGRAIAVAGQSGAGKSTLAAWMFDHGHRLIGDDVCVVRPQGEAMLAFPGIPRLRLWGEAIAATGRERDGLERAYAGDDDWDKWDVPVDCGAVVTEGLPLQSVYVLEDSHEIAITPLTGAAAAEALFAHTYRGDYLSAAGTAEGHWRSVTALLARVGVYRLARPFDLTRLDWLGAALLAHARGQAPRTSAAAPLRR